MNKKYISLAISVLLFSCSPITNDDNFNEAALDAATLNLSIEPTVVDGKNSNEIKVENHSPILSEWTLDGVTSHRASDKLIASKIGPCEIKFRGLNSASGTYTEKSITVNVETITIIPDDIKTRLCIGQEGAPTSYGLDLDLSKIKITVEKDHNGLNGNRITVVNSNPVMTDWDFGGATSDKNIAELYVFSLGETPLKAKFTKADGSVEEHSFTPIEIETYTFKPDFLVALTGGDTGHRTWTFDMTDGTTVYGFGAYGVDVTPTWFTANLGTLYYFADMIGRSDETYTGRMTFSITGEISRDVLNTTTNQFVNKGKGMYSFDMNAGKPGWSVGKIYFKGTSILCNWVFDSTNMIGEEAFEFDIVECNDERLILSTTCDGRDDAGTYWIFKPIQE